MADWTNATAEGPEPTTLTSLAARLEDVEALVAVRVETLERALRDEHEQLATLASRMERREAAAAAAEAALRSEIAALEARLSGRAAASSRDEDDPPPVPDALVTVVPRTPREG